MPRLSVSLAVCLSLLLAGCGSGNGEEDNPAADNTAPTGVDGGATTDEDTPVTVTLDVDDADGDALTVDVGDDVDHGTLAITGAGATFQATYTPAPDFNGSDTFVFSVDDGTDSSADVTIDITVNPVNDAPQATAAALATDEDTQLAGSLGGSDVEGDALTFALDGAPLHGVADVQADGSFTYTPDANYHGDDSFTFTSSDASSTSIAADVTVSIAPLNDAPSAVEDAASVPEGGSVSVLDGGAASLLDNDTDPDLPGDTLTMLTSPVATPLLFATSGVSLLGLDVAGGAPTRVATLKEPAGALAVTGSGGTVYAVAESGRTIYALDTSPGHATRVLRTPLRSIEALARARDGSLLAVARELTGRTALLVRVDPASGKQSMVAILAPQPAARVTGLAYDASFETLYALAGSDLYALDPRSGATTRLATLHAAGAKGLGVLADGRVLTTIGGVLSEVDVLSGATEAVGAGAQALGAIAADEPGPAHGELTLNPDGTFLYTHDGGETLTDSFVYEVHDEAGEPSQALVTIAIQPVFDQMPAFASSPLLAVNEDSAYSYDVSIEDADAGDTISITGAFPAWLTLTDHGDGSATLSGTPAEAAIGGNAVSLVATDAGGNTATQDFSVSVSNVNDVPAFTSVPVTQAFVNSTYVYELAAGDEDAGDVVSFSPAAPLPAWLGLLDNGDGTALLAGIPIGDDVGDVTISIRVKDLAEAASVQTFVLSVVSNNAGPSFQSAPVTQATEDVAYNYHLVATDANAGDSLSYTSVTPLPAWLTLTDNGNRSADLHGTPTGANAGDHAISIRVTDGEASSTQSFTIRVAAVNDAPAITSTPVMTVAEGSTYTYQLHATDEENNPITYSPATPLPAWLGLLDQGGGNALLAGIPIDDDVGVHQISLRATDSLGASTTQSFTLTVTPHNDAPVFTSTPLTSAIADAVYDHDVTATDADGDTLTILPAAPLPPWLGLLDFGNGTAKLAGIPVDDDVGSLSIQLKVVDSHGAEGLQTFTLTVSAH